MLIPSATVKLWAPLQKACVSICVL